MYDTTAAQDAQRYGILNRMQQLEDDIMKIKDIVNVEFDIRDYGEFAHVILVPKYAIDVTREDYYAARKTQIHRIIVTCAEHDLHPSGDRIEDYGEHWYIVMYCGKTWPRITDDIAAFVNSLTLHGAELAAITIDEAQQAMENWVRDGVELPSGMTAQRYMDAWNELICANYRKRFETIDKIVSRAEEMGIGIGTRITQMMDMQNADKQFHLRLDEFLAAEPMDFAHDYCGIQREINRKTCRIDGYFIPRFAAV